MDRKIAQNTWERKQETALNREGDCVWMHSNESCQTVRINRRQMTFQKHKQYAYIQIFSGIVCHACVRAFRVQWKRSMRMSVCVLHSQHLLLCLSYCIWYDGCVSLSSNKHTSKYTRPLELSSLTESHIIRSTTKIFALLIRTSSLPLLLLFCFIFSFLSVVAIFLYFVKSETNENTLNTLTYKTSSTRRREKEREEKIII